MHSKTRGRPDSTEFAPYAQAYVDLVAGDDVAKSLSTQKDSTASLLQSIDDKVAETSYAPGKWTIKELIAHLIDTERIFAYRALSVARGDATSLPGFEQEDYVKTSGANGRSLSDLTRELEAVRQSTIALFSSLPPEAWPRRGTVNGFNVTVRGLAYHIAGHELHHRKILEDKYLSATRP
jgi:uncharacterized damage-inducible protein DinB